MDINLASLYRNTVISSICKKHVIALVVLMIFFSPSNTQAQLPGPATLGVGLNAVTGNKGIIDTEILVDIILEKQAEIKNELIKKGIGKLLQDENYAIWEYGYLTTSALLEGNNKEIITQKILAQSTNMLMVYQFAEYGLEVDSIKNILKNQVLDAKNKADSIPLKLNMLDEDVKNMYIDLVYDVLINHPLVTRKLGLFANRLPFGLSFYKHINTYQKFLADSGKTFNATTIEKLAAKQKKTKQLTKEQLKAKLLTGKQLIGIRDTLYTRVSFYLNNYYLLKKILEKNGEYAVHTSVTNQFSDLKMASDDMLKKAFKLDSLLADTNKDFRASYEILKNNVAFPNSTTRERLSVLSSYNLIGEKRGIESTDLLKLKGYFDSLDKARKASINANRKKAIEFLQDSLIEEYREFKQEISGLMIPKSTATQMVVINSVSPTTAASIKELTTMLSDIDEFVGRVSKDGKEVFQNDLYYIQQKVKPMIGQLVVMNGLKSKYIAVVKKTETSLLAILTSKIDGSLLSEFNYKAGKNKEKNLLATIENLTELENPLFYQEVLAGLKSQLAEIPAKKDIANDGLKVMLSLLANIDLNTLANVADKTLEIDVEEVIIWMYDTFIDKVVNGGNSFAPYFTIGLNYSNIKLKDVVEKDKINQFSYASEKIGFAWKIYDAKHKRASKDFRNKDRFDFCSGKMKNKTKVLSPEPIISNFHFIAYASGILYTLVDATTEKEFDSPLGAVGAGFTFFNSLELNFSHVWPLDSDRSPTYSRFFQVSFDVKIVDYINAARKKRMQLKGK